MVKTKSQKVFWANCYVCGSLCPFPHSILNRVKMSFTLFYVTVRLPIDSIENNIFRFSTEYFNRKRLNYIIVYVQVFSWFKAKTFMHKNTNFSPLRFFLSHVRPYNLKCENLNVVYSCFQNNTMLNLRLYVEQISLKDSKFLFVIPIFKC